MAPAGGRGSEPALGGRCLNISSRPGGQRVPARRAHPQPARVRRGGAAASFSETQGLTGCPRPMGVGAAPSAPGRGPSESVRPPQQQGLKAAALTPSAKCCRPEGPKQWVKRWVGGFGEMGRGSDLSAQPEPEYQLTHAASTLMGPAFEKPSHLQRESRVGGPEGLTPWLAGRRVWEDSCRGRAEAT